MEFDYSEYEYLPECTDKCGALTDWLPSNDAAHEAALSHQKQTDHHCRVQQRMKELPVNKETPQATKK
jgi:hypothetical protein